MGTTHFLGDVQSNDASVLLGYATGYKLARGSGVATDSLAVVTGLTTIVAFSVTQRGSTGTTINAGVALQGSVSGGTLTIKRYKHTGVASPTLVAATVAGSVDWVAIGT